MPLVWNTETRKIKELKDYSGNPRRISKDMFEKLVGSLRTYGYKSRISIDTNNTIIGGHQRKRALLKSGYSKEDEIEVLVPSRELTTREFLAQNVIDNLPFGMFDFDCLSSDFDAHELVSMGMPENWLAVLDLEEEQSEEPTDGAKRKKKNCPECGADL